MASSLPNKYYHISTAKIRILPFRENFASLFSFRSWKIVVSCTNLQYIRKKILSKHYGCLFTTFLIMKVKTIHKFPHTVSCAHFNYFSVELVVVVVSEKEGKGFNWNKIRVLCPIILGNWDLTSQSCLAYHRYIFCVI